MAQIRLVPSNYSFSNSNYLTMTSASNMYTNTDSTTKATIQNTRSSTSSYYLYIKGFNFDDIPEDAIVSDFTVKLKAYHSGGNTSTNYLCNNTTTLSGCTASALDTSTSPSTLSFTCNLDFDVIKGYGSDFGIRINCRRSNRNTAAYIYIFGAEIDVTYTLPVYHTVTSSTSTGSISPSGST